MIFSGVNKRSLFAIGLSAVALVGCNDSDDTKDVSVNFAAMVGDDVFECGTTYSGVGVGVGDASNFQVNDYRVFVSDVSLQKSDGSKKTVELTEDGAWQYENVALLDFENGCNSGTTDLNKAISGTVDRGDYTGICLTVGVPFDKNHLDTATAASPLNASGMFWAWSSGHKFVRIDGVGDPGDDTHANKGFNMHLGSTGCSAASSTEAPAAECTYPNRMEVCLTAADGAFSLSDETINFDIKAVLAETNVTVDDQPPAGCMSFAGDDACRTIMPRLGLPYAFSDVDITDAVEQQFVSIAE